MSESEKDDYVSRVCDSKTCSQCQSLKGTTYKPEDVPDLPHPNCRCEVRYVAWGAEKRKEEETATKASSSIATTAVAAASPTINNRWNPQTNKSTAFGRSEANVVDAISSTAVYSQAAQYADVEKLLAEVKPFVGKVDMVRYDQQLEEYKSTVDGLMELGKYAFSNPQTKVFDTMGESLWQIVKMVAYLGADVFAIYGTIYGILASAAITTTGAGAPLGIAGVAASGSGLIFAFSKAGWDFTMLLSAIIMTVVDGGFSYTSFSVVPKSEDDSSGKLTQNALAWLTSITGSVGPLNKP